MEQASSSPEQQLLDKIKQDYLSEIHTNAVDHVVAAKELETSIPTDHLDKKVMAEIWLMLGEMLYLLQIDAQAITALDTSISYDDTLSRAYFFKGIIYAISEEYSKSFECYEKAIGLEPNKSAYHFELGRLYNANKEPEKALESFKKVVSISKEDAVKYQLVNSFYNLGVKFHMEKKYQTALDAFEHGVLLDEGDIQMQGKIVQLHETLQQFNKRDDKLEEIYAQYLNGAFGKEIRICRDQFSLDNCVHAGEKKVHVFVYEYFELVGDMAVKYLFQCLDETQKRVLFRVSLGSYTLSNQMYMELHHTTNRVYHLDSYFPNQHFTLDFYEGIDIPGKITKVAMSYDALKKKVIGYITGADTTTLSSSSRN